MSLRPPLPPPHITLKSPTHHPDDYRIARLPNPHTASLSPSIHTPCTPGEALAIFYGECGCAGEGMDRRGGVWKEGDRGGWRRPVLSRGGGGCVVIRDMEGGGRRGGEGRAQRVVLAEGVLDAACVGDERTGSESRVGGHVVSGSGSEDTSTDGQLTRIASYWRRLRRTAERIDGKVSGQQIEKAAASTEEEGQDIHVAKIPGGWAFESLDVVAETTRGSCRFHGANTKAPVSRVRRPKMEEYDIAGNQTDFLGASLRGMSKKDYRGVDGMTLDPSKLYDLTDLPPVKLVHPSLAGVPRANRAVGRVHGVKDPVNTEASGMRHHGDAGTFLSTFGNMLQRATKLSSHDCKTRKPSTFDASLEQEICSPMVSPFVFGVLKILLAVYAGFFAWHVGVLVVQALKFFWWPMGLVWRVLWWVIRRFWGLYS